MPTDRPAPAVPLADWLEHLIAQLPEGAASAPTPEEARALLDLACVAAHTSERIAAPLSTFLVGLAYSSREPADRGRLITELVGRLEDASKV